MTPGPRNGHWFELRSGASPQARALARTMLAQRQAELAQLQRWHHQEHNQAHD